MNFSWKTDFIRSNLARQNWRYMENQWFNKCMFFVTDYFFKINQNLIIWFKTLHILSKSKLLKPFAFSLSGNFQNILLIVIVS